MGYIKITNISTYSDQVLAPMSFQAQLTKQQQQQKKTHFWLLEYIEFWDCW